MSEENKQFFRLPVLICAVHWPRSIANRLSHPFPFQPWGLDLKRSCLYEKSKVSSLKNWGHEALSLENCISHEPQVRHCTMLKVWWCSEAKIYSDFQGGCTRFLGGELCYRCNYFKITEDYSREAFTLAFVRFSCKVGFPWKLLPDAGSQHVKGCQSLLIFEIGYTSTGLTFKCVKLVHIICIVELKGKLGTLKILSPNTFKTIDFR